MNVQDAPTTTDSTKNQNRPQKSKKEEEEFINIHDFQEFEFLNYLGISQEFALGSLWQ